MPSPLQVFFPADDNGVEHDLCFLPQFLVQSAGGLIVAFAVSLVFVRRRFAVVILLGGVGYGIAGLYAVLGGPDLTITQLLVETLVIALFAGLRERTEAADVPLAFRGAAISLVTAAFMALGFMGFAGMASG